MMRLFRHVPKKTTTPTTPTGSSSSRNQVLPSPASQEKLKNEAYYKLFNCVYNQVGAGVSDSGITPQPFKSCETEYKAYLQLKK